jgi:hypothetical protein
VFVFLTFGVIHLLNGPKELEDMALKYLKEVKKAT